MPLVSPLRYPGGKSRALAKIVQQLPERFAEYREPFVGGGSVFIHLRQMFPAVPMWINDLNFDLYCFWQAAQRDANHLADSIQQVKDTTTDGRALFETLRGQAGTALPDFERAVRFFVLNRISFSGTVDSGGYSEGAYRGRFTDSCIARVSKLGSVLENVKITNEDYREIIHAPGTDVFLFLDPPYFAATKSRLYGINGALHTSFDHQVFASEMQRCPHLWLITYDNSPEIRAGFRFAFQDEWQLQYGMNNFGRNYAPKGQELFIANYAHQPRRAQQLNLLEQKRIYHARKIKTQTTESP